MNVGSSCYLTALGALRAKTHYYGLGASFLVIGIAALVAAGDAERARAQPGRQLVRMNIVVSVAQSNRAGIEPGAECDVGFEEVTAGGFNCRIRIACGRTVLYGGGDGGFGRCAHGANGSLLLEDATWTDGDASMLLRITPGQGCVARVADSTWSVELTSPIDTMWAARTESDARSRAAMAQGDLERAQRRTQQAVDARARIAEAMAGLATIEADLRATATYATTLRSTIEQRIGDTARPADEAIAPVFMEVEAERRLLDERRFAIRPLLDERIRALLPAFVDQLLARGRATTWQTGRAAAVALYDEARIVLGDAGLVGLADSRSLSPGTVDYGRELARLVEHLGELRFEIDSIETNRGHWCVMLPERVRYLRSAISQTSGAERRELQQDLADVQADIADAARFLRAHGIRPAQAMCDAP